MLATCKDCLHVEACNGILNGFDIDIEFFGEQVSVCKNFKDRSRFVELPDDFPKNRLTTDKPSGNYGMLLNYSYVKDGNVLLRYANSQKNVDLCDYISFQADDCYISPRDVLDGACLECDDFYCPIGRAYIASVQAAELRERLKLYEDLAEQALKEREKG